MSLTPVLTLLAFQIVLVFCQEPVVLTQYGKVKGMEQKTTDGSALYVFSGIPYAEQPLNELRFKDPVPLKTSYSADVFEAKKTTRCVQYLFSANKVIGQENCLTLNIYTTTLRNDANYDVLVFIHGGLFNFGSGHSQTPEYIYDHNKKLVFVSINYRLGPFGFLSTGDDVVPGNMGLKDQVMALKWIKENIGSFGGNPKNVVLMGMSAGAISVQLHYMSSGSRDLFAKGISMSGDALSMAVRSWKPRGSFEKLLSLFPDCQKKSSTLEKIDCLRFQVSAHEIVEKLKIQIPVWKDSSSYLYFCPVVDKGSSTPFLDEHPFHLLRKGKIKSAPFFVSATSNEGLSDASRFIDDVKILEELDKEWTDHAPNFLQFNELADDEDLPKISDMVKKHYFGDSKISFDNRIEMLRLIGDRFHMNSIENSVRLHAAASRSHVYMYMFDYMGKQSSIQLLSKTGSNMGPAHTDDLIYILKMKGFSIKSEDLFIHRIMVTALLSFIKHGIPDTGTGIRWPAVSRSISYVGNIDYVLLDNEGPKVMSTPQLSETVFWDTLPLNELHVSGDLHVPKYIQDLQIGSSWWLSREERNLHVIYARLLRKKPFAYLLKKMILRNRKIKTSR